MTVILEEYDIAVIALNVVAFIAGFVFVLAELSGELAMTALESVGDGYWLTVSVIVTLSRAAICVLATVCIGIDMLWINSKNKENKRWL